MKKFTDLGLSEKNLNALHRKGFEEPTEIQELTIPLLLKNEIDIIAQAQTGTGKTAAFALPLLEKISPKDSGTQAIILAPTRELVIQICEEINSLQDKSKLKIAPIYGGQFIGLQLSKLEQGVSIVVGTPGRVIDHINRGSLKLDQVKFFILDEADEMLNMGFIDDIKEIFDKTPKEKRVLLFSATMPNDIKKLAEEYMEDYAHLKTKTKLTTHLTDQIYFEVKSADKFEALCRIIDIEPNFYGLIFCRTKMDVDEIADGLIDRGYSADKMHGDISQSQREMTLNKFRRKTISILVATDVAARGIDVENITHVINYSIPQNPEAYVHRIGRTGRAGNQGTAITFITPAEFRKLGFIQRITKTDIRREDIPQIHDIIKAKKEQVLNDIQKIIDTGVPGHFLDWAHRLIENEDPVLVLGAFLKNHYEKSIDSNSYQKIRNIKRNEQRDVLVEDGGKTRLFIARGKSKNMTKKSLVSLIVEQAGTPSHLIQEVEIYDNFSFVTVPFVEAEIIIDRFRKSKDKGRPMIQEASSEKSLKKKKGKK
ncbi:MAG: DEAD/DEAH box helicase [Candidatus Marinimicrobia bacterium]|nr:DEAD/DEAH box helicase [Candidatus Neomarinimicrobiota bacterium]